MSKAEFDAALDAPQAVADELRSLYTLVRRPDDGALTAVPYQEPVAEPLAVSVAKLREAADLADIPVDIIFRQGKSTLGIGEQRIAGGGRRKAWNTSPLSIPPSAIERSAFLRERR
jgi:hypothetical protein